MDSSVNFQETRWLGQGQGRCRLSFASVVNISLSSVSPSYHEDIETWRPRSCGGVTYFLLTPPHLALKCMSLGVVAAVIRWPLQSVPGPDRGSRCSSVLVKFRVDGAQGRRSAGVSGRASMAPVSNVGECARRESSFSAEEV